MQVVMATAQLLLGVLATPQLLQEEAGQLAAAAAQTTTQAAVLVVAKAFIS